MRHILYTAGNAESHKELGKKLRELKPGNYIIQVKKSRPIRSLSANKFYHYILNVICIETGFTHEELHEAMKMKFNCTMIYFPKGGNQVVPKSTASLDSLEFTGYLNRVRNWAVQEFGIEIKDKDQITHAQWLESENTYDDNQLG